MYITIGEQVFTIREEHIERPRTLDIYVQDLLIDTSYIRVAEPHIIAFGHWLDVHVSQLSEQPTERTFAVGIT